MGAWGAIIMGFFGAVFASLTMFWQSGVTGPPLALPFTVFAGIALGAIRIVRLPGRGLVPSAAADRAITWSTVAEGVGLFLVSNVVINLHRPELLLPAMVLIVGLHFLPIAYAAPFPPFYVLGAALILAATAGFVLPTPSGGMVAGFAAASGLGVASLSALRRDWREKRATAIAP